MNYRLPNVGRLIDRDQPVSFTFNDKKMTGFKGDTLASALMANDQMVIGRSFKYHRPRGFVASGVEEPNGLMNLADGPFFEPNQRATTQDLYEGLEAGSQNHWPSLENDIGAVNGRLSRFLTAGFYYKTFIHPRAAWKHLFEPFIRHSAGLGKAPKEPDADSYDHMHVHVDLLVIGGGVAGLAAAKDAAQSGSSVLVLEQAADWGGRACVDGATVEGQPADIWVSETLAALQAAPNVHLLTRTTGAGLYDHGYALAYQRLTDHLADKGGPRHRLWKIRAREIVTATGAIERPLSFPGNDVPGVMLASAVRDYAINWGVVPGKRVVVFTNNDDAYRTALCLHHLGVEVPAILDARPAGHSPVIAEAVEAGIDIRFGRAIAKVTGHKAVEAIGVSSATGTGGAVDMMACDAIAMSGGWSPVVHLWSHCGGKLTWDADLACFRPNPTTAPKGADGQPIVRAVGAANGYMSTPAILADARGEESPSGLEEPCVPPMATWILPMKTPHALRQKMWLDFQNDVKVTDVQQAAQEGFESVEHTKRYTTLGMATDQGKLSNINGLAVLAETLHKNIPQVGTTTFRPPYTPISMASIAGEARGDLFQPLRRTPMHDWHDAHGAHWEPVGQWRRPYCYLRDGETVEQAVHREVKNTRQAVGLLDASTLGKLIVKGPDAGKFLDLIYTNMMSSLKIGRCRYGLMCSENGFLSDDGVVARLDEHTFLCHTTSGGADRIHAHLEEWLQTEWWDMQVYVANLTEQFGQIAVVGPQARALLEALDGDIDLSAAALPFMGWAKGVLGGVPIRIYRISFSGELSYEIAAPTHQAQGLWDTLFEAGQALGVMPYGTEALHIMRAEKGFIMIGDETDGTVIPQDLGLQWAVSKKKDDFIGKRAQARPHMVDEERWQLVGLETEDGSVLPDGAYAVDTDRSRYPFSGSWRRGTSAGVNANGQIATQGRVTSTYHSPTLGRGIALGLVRKGSARMGETLTFPGTDGRDYHAKIVSPVFYDPDGEKQNV